MNTPIEPVAWVERVENGNARMWSGDLSAWRDRPANPEPLYDQKTVDALIQSRDFYARRCEALQAIQGQMSDPERQAVCDILANGSTQVFAAGHCAVGTQCVCGKSGNPGCINWRKRANP